MAGGQFALSLVLLQRLDVQSFGVFSFLLVMSQLTMGLSGALLCAPYPVHLKLGELEAEVNRCFLSINLLISGVAFLMFYAAAWAMGSTGFAALIFASYAALTLIRWFARAFFYVHQAPLRTLMSDVACGITLAAASVSIATQQSANLTIAFGAMLVSSILGMIPVGIGYLSQQFQLPTIASVRTYEPVWRQHSKWSLVGVLTTEATANAHAYLVTLIGGAAAFAPLAASSLLVRPITIAANALGDFERPAFAGKIAAGHDASLRRSVVGLRLALASVGLGSVLLAVLVVTIAPKLVIPPHYEMHTMMIALTLWFAISFVRLARTSESIVLQAAGWFGPLAGASIISCGISIVLVAVFIAVSGPIWSLLGVLVGEIIFAQQIYRQLARWRMERMISSERKTP